MQAAGLQVITLDAAATAQFRAAAEKLAATQRGGIIPADVYDAGRSRARRVPQATQAEMTGGAARVAAGRARPAPRSSSPRSRLFGIILLPLSEVVLRRLFSTGIDGEATFAAHSHPPRRPRWRRHRRARRQAARARHRHARAGRPLADSCAAVAAALRGRPGLGHPRARRRGARAVPGRDRRAPSRTASRTGGSIWRFRRVRPDRAASRLEVLAGLEGPGADDRARRRGGRLARDAARHVARCGRLAVARSCSSARPRSACRSSRCSAAPRLIVYFVQGRQRHSSHHRRARSAHVDRSAGHSALHDRRVPARRRQVVRTAAAFLPRVLRLDAGRHRRRDRRLLRVLHAVHGRLRRDDPRARRTAAAGAARRRLPRASSRSACSRRPARSACCFRRRCRSFSTASSPRCRSPISSSAASCRAC